MLKSEMKFHAVNGITNYIHTKKIALKIFRAIFIIDISLRAITNQLTSKQPLISTNNLYFLPHIQKFFIYIKFQSIGSIPFCSR
jgi:hypothetical protein